MFKSLTPILSILIAIVLFVFFTKPLFQEVNAINTEVAQYSETINQYEKFKSDLNRLKQAKSTVRTTDRERVDAMIPDEADNTQTLVDLEAMATSQDLLFGNISVEETEFSTEATQTDLSVADSFSRDLVSHTITFEVIGTYSQFKEFLKSIESSLTFMEITGISLSAATDFFQQYSITVETYSLPKS